MRRNNSSEAQDPAEQIAALAKARGLQIAVAESLTSGRIACRLGAASDASTWFAGGVVAYAAEVKFTVLRVEPGPVVTARCAAQMATGVARLLGAEIAVAATGVGGPEPDEGHPPGTVYLAVNSGGRVEVVKHRFDGHPAQVVDIATSTALELLYAALKAD